MIIIERKFNLKPDCREKFLNILSDYFVNIDNDPHVKTYAIVTTNSQNNCVITRFIVENSESWEKRMQQEYVCEFLKKSESLVDSIQTDTQPIIKFYTEENT